MLIWVRCYNAFCAPWIPLFWSLASRPDYANVAIAVLSAKPNGFSQKGSPRDAFESPNVNMSLVLQYFLHICNSEEIVLYEPPRRQVRLLFQASVTNIFARLMIWCVGALIYSEARKANRDAEQRRGRIVFETVSWWMPISAHRLSVLSRAKQQLQLQQ